jgi:hypothetical protein
VRGVDVGASMYPESREEWVALHYVGIRVTSPSPARDRATTCNYPADALTDGGGINFESLALAYPPLRPRFLFPFPPALALLSSLHRHT